MGSLVSPAVANLYMEHFEREALRSASHHSRLWYRFVDDTWVIQQQAFKELFLDHINSSDPCIKFMVKGNQDNGAIPFLDTLVQPEVDNSLSIKVYHKPTHTDQYLQWDTHHNLSAKYSVIGTLTHRAKTVCPTQGLLDDKLKHLKEALVRCKYPRWAINKVINGNWEDNGTNHVGNTSQDTSTSSSNNQTSTISRGRPSMGHIIIPYIWGLGEVSNAPAPSMGFKHTSEVTGPLNRCW